MWDGIAVGSCVPAAKQASATLDVVKTVTSVVAIPFAAVTFFAGYRQKERERTRAYYHKVVVDVVLPEILAFFGQQAELLTETGRKGLKGLASARKTLPRDCSLALSNFSTGLYSLLNKVTERTLIFDESITELVRNDFAEIEEVVTGWFSDVTLFKKRNPEEITQLLQTGQRRVIKRLYKGEFRDF